MQRKQSKGMNVSRGVTAFLVWFIFGLIGMGIDFDHVLCAYYKGIPIFPLSGLHGCKIWHIYLVPAGGIIFGLSVTLLVGCMAVCCAKVWNIRRKENDKEI